MAAFGFLETVDSEGQGKYKLRCSHVTDQSESTQCVVDTGQCHFFRARRWPGSMLFRESYYRGIIGLVIVEVF